MHYIELNLNKDINYTRLDHYFNYQHKGVKMGNRSSSKLARALVDDDMQAAEKIYEINKKNIKPFEFITKSKNDTWYGTTLMHCAALGGNEMFLRLFLEKDHRKIKSNITKLNLAQESILHCACGGGIGNQENPSRLGCIVYILNHIPSRETINIQDQSGRTALHHAARRGRRKIVDLLLEAGADERILNHSSMTPADEAQQGGAATIASHIESKTIFSSLADKNAKVRATSHTSLRDIEGKGLILQDIRSEKDGALIEMSTMLGVDLWTAEALLRFFKWDKTKTANEFLSNPHNTCKKAGVSLSTGTNNNKNYNFNKRQNKCLICGEEELDIRKETVSTSTMNGNGNNDKQVEDVDIGVWYEDNEEWIWIEEIDYLKSIQLSMTKPIDKMKVQRLINNLKSQQLRHKEKKEDSKKSSNVNAISTNPFTMIALVAKQKEKRRNRLEMIELPACGHTFCKKCWGEYLKMKIKNANMKIVCPEKYCNQLIPIDIIQQIVPYDVGQKYLYFDLKSFVESNKNIQWCPRPTCDYAIKKVNNKTILNNNNDNFYHQDADAGWLPHGRSSKYRRQNRDQDFFFNGATCLCEHRFCFKCNASPPHDPASCKMMEDWKELINTYIGMEKHKMTVAGEITGANDLASEIWLRANTKNCPKCKVKIQKNDGCNHMTCKHCTHEFCWICMGPWKEHGNNTGGFFRCDIYKGSGAKTNKEEKKQSDAKAKDIENFLLFYTQSVAHQNSLYLEKPLLASAEARMIDILESTNQSNTDVTFVNSGFHILIKSRSILKASWIWAYFKASYLASKTDALKAKVRNGKKFGKRKDEIIHAIHELSAATEKLSDMLARRRFRHQRSDIVKSINVSYAAVDKFYRVLLRK